MSPRPNGRRGGRDWHRFGLRRTLMLVLSTGLGVVLVAEGVLTWRTAQEAADAAYDRSLLGAIKALKPTAIIGVSAVGGTFTKEVLEEMAKLNERPIVFALSNPTSRAECTAEQAYRWTGGRALDSTAEPGFPAGSGASLA